MSLNQTLVCTVIPRSVTLGAGALPVSVLVSPRLAGADRLGEFPDWLAWPQRLKDSGLKLTLRCGGVTYDAAGAPGTCARRDPRG